MSQFKQMTSVIEELRVPSPLQISQLRELLGQSENCTSMDGSVKQRDWNNVLRIVHAAEQLQLLCQHWKEQVDVRREDQEKGA